MGINPFCKGIFVCYLDVGLTENPILETPLRSDRMLQFNRKL